MLDPFLVYGILWSCFPLADNKLARYYRELVLVAATCELVHTCTLSINLPEHAHSLRVQTRALEQSELYVQRALIMTSERS